MEHFSPSSCIEKYNLSDSDDVVRFAFGKNVLINIDTTNNSTRKRDSKRARSQILTDYKWDNKSGCYGRTLSVRNNSIAYRLFNESTGEAVRVLERETRARRLIKDFNQPIVDIQWATHAPFLAVLDISGSIYIYHVDEKSNTLSKFLNILNSQPLKGENMPLLAWCPYIPEDDVDANKDVHMLAVAFGSTIYIYLLHVIKQAVPYSEIAFEQVRIIPGGVLNVTMDSEITSVKLSPDATAMAVATMDGYISFYVIDNDHTRFANHVRPIPNNYAEEIMFLDNLTAQNQDQFWKFVVVSADSGRRLAIYDCDSWNCLGKLRFESPNQINRLDFSMEPTAHFIFMADYDTSCLYCLELNYTSGSPCFTACTRITFFNSLLCITPCVIAENAECELSLEESNEQSDSSVIATFIAITNRSLMEVNVELERHQLDPGSFILGRSVGPEATTLEAVEQSLLSMSELPNTSAVTAANVNNGNEANLNPNVSSIINKATTAKTKKSSQWENISSSTTLVSKEDFSLKLAATLDEKLLPLINKVNFLQADIQKLQMENQTLREENTDRLSNVLEKISNEMKAQIVRVELLINEAATKSREQIVGVVEASLAVSTHNFQAAANLSKNEILSTVSSTVQQILVPTVENVCSQMFNQMNEKFSQGLQEFMNQLAQFQRESSLYYMKHNY